MTHVRSPAVDEIKHCEYMLNKFADDPCNRKAYLKLNGKKCIGLIDFMGTNERELINTDDCNPDRTGGRKSRRRKHGKKHGKKSKKHGKKSKKHSKKHTKKHRKSRKSRGRRRY